MHRASAFSRTGDEENSKQHRKLSESVRVNRVGRGSP